MAIYSVPAKNFNCSTNSYNYVWGAPKSRKIQEIEQTILTENMEHNQKCRDNFVCIQGTYIKFNDCKNIRDIELMEKIQGTLGSNDSMMKMKNKLYSHSHEGKGRHKMYIK